MSSILLPPSGATGLTELDPIGLRTAIRNGVFSEHAVMFQKQQCFHCMVRMESDGADPDSAELGGMVMRRSQRPSFWGTPFSTVRPPAMTFGADMRHLSAVSK